MRQVSLTALLSPLLKSGKGRRNQEGTLRRHGEWEQGDKTSGECGVLEATGGNHLRKEGVRN